VDGNAVIVEGHGVAALTFSLASFVTVFVPPLSIGCSITALALGSISLGTASHRFGVGALAVAAVGLAIGCAAFFVSVAFGTYGLVLSAGAP